MRYDLFTNRSPESLSDDPDGFRDGLRYIPPVIAETYPGRPGNSKSNVLPASASFSKLFGQNGSADVRIGGRVCGTPLGHGLDQRSKDTFKVLTSLDYPVLRHLTEPSLGLGLQVSTLGVILDFPWIIPSSPV